MEKLVQFLAAYASLCIVRASAGVMIGCLLTTGCLLQVTFPLVLDTYEFCSDDLKKQLDGPRVAVREEEDRKANKDRAAKKAKMVRTHNVPNHMSYHDHCKPRLALHAMSGVCAMTLQFTDMGLQCVRTGCSSN